jgi:hypothetical protein
MPVLIVNNLGLILVAVGLILFVAFALLARLRGFDPALRPLRGYANFQATIGQAVESGGRMHVSLGTKGIAGEDTGVTLAGLAALEIATEASVIGDKAPVATTGDATTLPVLADSVRRVYRSSDAEDKYEPKSPRLVALDPYSLAGGATSIIADDDVRANLLIGAFGPEVVLMTEAGSRKHIPQTVGSSRLEGQAAAYVTADQALIGEEIFMARAYLSDKPSAKASLALQDVLRWLVIGLIVFGAVLQTLGLLG